MNKEMLLLLADYLEGKGRYDGKGVPAIKFDLGLWSVASENYVAQQLPSDRNTAILATRVKDKPAYDTLSPEELQKLKEFDSWMNPASARVPATCQTVGCALGHAPAIPEIRKAGLVLENVDGTLIPRYRGYCGMDAACVFFDITYVQATELFGPDHYPQAEHNDPTAVARKIRKLVETGKV